MIDSQTSTCSSQMQIWAFWISDQLRNSWSRRPNLERRECSWQIRGSGCFCLIWIIKNLHFGIVLRRRYRLIHHFVDSGLSSTHEYNSVMFVSVPLLQRYSDVIISDRRCCLVISKLQSQTCEQEWNSWSCVRTLLRPLPNFPGHFRTWMVETW